MSEWNCSTCKNDIDISACYKCEDSCNRCENGSKFIRKTNADRIRSMTDEELAKFLQGVKYSGVYRDGDYPFQSEVWEEWLQEDSEV